LTVICVYLRRSTSIQRTYQISDILFFRHNALATLTTRILASRSIWQRAVIGPRFVSSPGER
jgi:hypothetical protein